MSNDNSVILPAISPKLFLSSTLNEKTKEHYKQLYKKLPMMQDEQLMITGVELKIEKTHTLKVLCFIRSTLKRPIRINTRKIILFDENSEFFAKKDEGFNSLGRLLPNTAKPFMIEFSKEHLKQLNINNLGSWSIDFEENKKQRIDFSSLDENKLSHSTKSWLEELSKKNHSKETNYLLWFFQLL